MSFLRVQWENGEIENAKRKLLSNIKNTWISRCLKMNTKHLQQFLFVYWYQFTSLNGHLTHHFHVFTYALLLFLLLLLCDRWDTLFFFNFHQIQMHTKVCTQFIQCTVAATFIVSIVCYHSVFMPRKHAATHRKFTYTQTTTSN